MNFKYYFHVVVIGMAIFSMFFGGGNLTFPLWVGSETSSVLISSLGFILTGVLLPCFGIAVSLYFNGNYENFLGVCGKTVGRLLIFSLLLFWIPLGSGPRCNLLAYGAYVCQFGDGIPMWAYSALYSVLVYFLAVKKNRVLEILGSVITPLLIVSLFFVIFSVLMQNPVDNLSSTQFSDRSEFIDSLYAGYNTMDFIAAIFFSSTVIGLIREKQGSNFNMRFVRNACLIAIGLLSAVYVGMISVGYLNSDLLLNVSRDQLLAVIGQKMFHPDVQIIIFTIITLSVLSTSMALALVFSDYLRKVLFKEKLNHKICLFLSVLISFVVSTVGFDALASLISYAMGTLYPVLLAVTTVALIKSLKQKSELLPPVLNASVEPATKS